MPCPFIITKGDRKGLVCGGVSRNDDIPYCRTHLRNVGVQKELMAKGIDMTPPSIKPAEVPSSTPGPIPSGPRPIDKSYSIPVVAPKPPKPRQTKKEPEDSFINSFSSALDKHVDSSPLDSNIDLDPLYDNLDEIDEDELDEEYMQEREDELIQEQRQTIELQQKQILAQQRRITSMFTVKQLMYLGISTGANMVEDVSPDALQGYQRKVVESPAINELLDEMTDDVESMIGFSELPAWLRLISTMSILAGTTALENRSGVDVAPPVPPPAPAPTPAVDPATIPMPDFSVPYKD